MAGGIQTSLAGHSGRRMLFALALLAAAAPLPAPAHTLSEALALAYQGNPKLAAARAELRATDESINQALVPSRPSASVTASKGLANNQTHDIATLSPPNYNYAPTQVDVRLKQDLWRGGRTDVEEDAALKDIFAARAGLVHVEQTVLHSVVTDYLDVYAAQRIFDFHMEYEKLLREQVESIRAQLRISAITQTDLAQAQAAYSQALSSLAAARGQLRSYEATYIHDVGETPGTLAPPGGLPQLPATRDEAITRAEHEAPTVQRAQYSVEAADARLEAKRRELLPTVSVVGEYSLGTQSQTTNSRLETGQVMAQISIPLFDGGMVASQSRADAAVKWQRQKELDDERLAAAEAARQAWDQLEASRQSVAALTEAVKLQEQAVAGVRAELSLGTRHIYDLLVQEQNLLDARINLVTAERDEAIQRASVARAVGLLTAKGLALPVEGYDPEKNFNAIHHAWTGLGSDGE